MALSAQRIFVDALLEEIASADLDGLSASKAGFALSASGRPNMVFGNLAVVGINY